MSRILIIDDEPSIRQIMTQVLAAHGHETVAAADGVEGAALLRTHSVDLVITDLIMPGAEGIETIIGMRRANPGLPIIAMSGTIDGRGYLRMARLLGARRTLQKPFTTQGLLKAINGVLNGVGENFESPGCSAVLADPVDS